MRSLFPMKGESQLAFLEKYKQKCFRDAPTTTTFELYCEPGQYHRLLKPPTGVEDTLHFSVSDEKNVAIFPSV